MLLRKEPHYSVKPREGLQEDMLELEAAIDLANSDELTAIADQIKDLDSPFTPDDLVWLSVHSEVINNFLEKDKTLNEEWGRRLKVLHNPDVPLVSMEDKNGISVFTQYKAAYFWNCYKHHKAKGGADSPEAQFFLDDACESGSFYALIEKLNHLKVLSEKSTTNPRLISAFKDHIMLLADRYWTVGLMAAGMYWMVVADYYRDRRDAAHCAEAFESAVKAFLLGSCLEAHLDSVYLAKVYYPENGWLDIFRVHPVFSEWRSSEDAKQYLGEIVSSYVIEDDEFFKTCLAAAEKRSGEIYSRFPENSFPGMTR